MKGDGVAGDVGNMRLRAGERNVGPLRAASRWLLDSLKPGRGNGRPGTLRNIQTLRFLAATWVAIYHMQPPVTPFTFNWVPESLRALGFAGVDLFFVISGLIMAEATRTLPSGSRPALRFLGHRFARIYSGWWPFFILYLTFFSLMGWLRPQVDLLGSLLLWPQDLMLYLLPITWTLSFELYFYVVVALLIGWRRQHAAPVLVVCGLVIIALNVWFHHNELYLPKNEAKAKTSLFVPFYASPLVLEFIAGFLLAEWMHRRPDLRLRYWLAGAVSFAALAFWYQYHMPLFDSGMAGFFHASERAVLVGGFACCLTACAMVLERRKFTPLRPLQLLGDASYSIYLAHILVFGGITMAYYKFPLLQQLSMSAWALLALTITLTFSWVNYQWVERPLYAFIRRRIG